jgi:hypothetical protein
MSQDGTFLITPKLRFNDRTKHDKNLLLFRQLLPSPANIKPTRFAARSINGLMRRTRLYRKAMSFYMPQLKAFYLSRDCFANSVALKKRGRFGKANQLDSQRRRTGNYISG